MYLKSWQRPKVLVFNKIITSSSLRKYTVHRKWHHEITTWHSEWEVEGLRNWISTKQTYKLWLLHPQIKFCYTVNDSMKKKWWINFFIIVFKIQSNTIVEIYVQKETIETCIHKAEVLFRGLQELLLLRDTWESKLSRFLTIKHLQCDYFFYQSNIYCTYSIPLNHISYV